MILENELSATAPEIPIEFPESIGILQNNQPEIPATNLLQGISSNIDITPDGYNESLNNLLTKYKRK